MKKIVAAGMAVLMILGSSMTSFAAQGWNRDNKGWWYEYEDGSYAKNSWKWIDGKKYYFNGNGYMLENTTTPDGKNVNSDGAWTVDGIVQNDNYDPNYPLKGMLEELGLNSTGIEGWDIMYGGNPNGDTLPANGKYYYINKGSSNLAAFVAVLSGEAYIDSYFGQLDPIETIAGNNNISYVQAQQLAGTVRDFLNSFDWRNASDIAKAKRTAELVTQSFYSSKAAMDKTVYGALMNKQADCAGLSSSYHLLTRVLGMDSLRLTNVPTDVGKTYYLGDHAWNFIRIDDIWYTFDGASLQYAGTGTYNFDEESLRVATLYMPGNFDENVLNILGFNQ